MAAAKYSYMADLALEGYDLRTEFGLMNIPVYSGTTWVEGQQVGSNQVGYGIDYFDFPSGRPGLAELPLSPRGDLRALAPNACTGEAKFSAVGPGQATDLGALAAFGIPGHQTGGVAVNPAIFGLPLPGGKGNIGVQRQLAGMSPFISIYPAGLNLYGGPQAPYFISDIGDKNIRNSATPRFDLYGFPTLKSAQQFGIQTVPTTILVTGGLPCPTGFSGGQQ
jgi:hypothetical protein